MDTMIVFMLGSVIGSFLNVCIYRIPLEKSIIYPRSSCLHCGKVLTIIDLIPMISYILLGGKCRYCKKNISIRYASIELLTATLFIFAYMNLGMSFKMLEALIIISFLIIITFIDYDYQLILDKLLIPMGMIGVVFIFANSLLYDYLLYNKIADALIGSLVGGGLLFLINCLSRGGIGWGDIKFSIVIGIWLGWQHTLITLLLAFILGGIVGIVLIAFKLKGRKDYIPFGPFLSLAMFINYFYGDQIIYLYLEWLL
jgi:leader peptidase (prepilin peptidase) / N-methyltransferase